MIVIWIYLKYNSRLSRIWIIIYIMNITRYKVRVQSFLCGMNHCDKLLSNIRWNERSILIVFNCVVIQDILWNREHFSVQCDEYSLLVCYFSSQNPIQKNCNLYLCSNAQVLYFWISSNWQSCIRQRNIVSLVSYRVPKVLSINCFDFLLKNDYIQNDQNHVNQV